MPNHLCHAPTADGTRCSARARFNTDGAPLCGIHVRVRARALAAGRDYIIPAWEGPEMPDIIVLDDADAPPPPPEHRCQRCTHALRRTEIANGDTFCAPCRNHRAVVPEAERCTHHLQGNRVRRPCLMRHAPGLTLCRTHERVRQNKVFRDLLDLLIRTVNQAPANWAAIVQQVETDEVAWPFTENDRVHALTTVARAFVIPELYNRLHPWGPQMRPDGAIDWEAWRNGNGAWGGAADPTLPPPRGELEAFTRDNQNVHTRVVTEQTNKTIEMLLNTPLTEQRLTGQLLTEIGLELARFRTPQREKAWTAVIYDISSWIKRPTCRTAGDHLYRRVLEGLWTRILASPHKEDLVQRLWEECKDANGMCCDGHITRLCNVLAGYDDEVTTTVSLNEQLQQRMGAIAMMDVTDDVKRTLAESVLSELNVPVENRTEWIEAF